MQASAAVLAGAPATARAEGAALLAGASADETGAELAELVGAEAAIPTVEEHPASTAIAVGHASNTASRRDVVRWLKSVGLRGRMLRILSSKRLITLSGPYFAPTRAAGVCLLPISATRLNGRKSSHLPGLSAQSFAVAPPVTTVRRRLWKAGDRRTHGRLTCGEARMTATRLDIAQIGQTATPPGPVRITGEVRRPHAVTLPDLLALPQLDLDVSFLCRSSGVRRHSFSGPLLLDVVAAAEPAFAPDERKDRLRFVLSLRAADGHRVVLSWAEIDPEFGNGAVLLGVTRDGAPLAEAGPQLVVPGDTCGARNMSGVVEVRIYGDPAE